MMWIQLRFVSEAQLHGVCMFQFREWSLAMMTEFLHLNPLCGLNMSFLTLSSDHNPKMWVLTAKLSMFMMSGKGKALS